MKRLVCLSRASSAHQCKISQSESRASAGYWETGAPRLSGCRVGSFPLHLRSLLGHVVSIPSTVSLLGALGANKACLFLNTVLHTGLIDLGSIPFFNPSPSTGGAPLPQLLVNFHVYVHLNASFVAFSSFLSWEFTPKRKKTKIDADIFIIRPESTTRTVLSSANPPFRTLHHHPTDPLNPPVKPQLRSSPGMVSLPTAFSTSTSKAPLC